MVKLKDIEASQAGLDRDALAVEANRIVPIGPSPASKAIPTERLSPAPLIKVPSVSQDVSQADGMVAGAGESSKSIADYIKEVTPPETETSKQYSTIVDSINTLLPGLANRSTDQLQAEKEAKLPQLKQQLGEINAQILTRNAAYEKAFADAETKAIPLPFIIGTQAATRRAQAADIGLLQARALGLQGQVQMAQETADRAIDLKYDSIRDQIDVKLQQLEMIRPILDKEERTFAQALERQYTDQRERLAETKEKAKTNMGLALEAGLTTKYVNKNGEFFHTATGETFGTPEEFFKHAGVSSFEEAYQRGLIGDYNPDLSINRSIIADMITKYPDAGITLRDTLETARAKLSSSRIYRDNTRGPSNTSSVSERLLLAQSGIINSARLALQGESQSSKDGKSNPNTYRDYLSQYIAAGGTENEFKAALSIEQYISPTNQKGDLSQGRLYEPEEQRKQFLSTEFFKSGYGLKDKDAAQRMSAVEAYRGAGFSDEEILNMMQ